MDVKKVYEEKLNLISQKRNLYLRKFLGATKYHYLNKARSSQVVKGNFYFSFRKNYF